MDKLIVITLPESFSEEASLVELMLRKGIDRVHIRKRSEADAETLIDAIPPELRPRLSVHYYPGLVDKFGVGWHISGSTLRHPLSVPPVVSRSCHSVEELSADADYRFLSPIYDSISKSGYKSGFNLAELQLPPLNVYALGGVTPANFEELYDAGFAGAAMLGYIWADLNYDNIIDRIDAAIYYSYKL